MNQTIEKLKDLIEEYEEVDREIEEMKYRWRRHGDSGSDPGVIFEISERMDGIYEEIKELLKEM